MREDGGASPGMKHPTLVLSSVSHAWNFPQGELLDTRTHECPLEAGQRDQIRHIEEVAAHRILPFPAGMSNSKR